MAISEIEFQKEKKILKQVQKLLGDTLSSLGEDVYQEEEDLIEFKKMMWENANSFDEAEMQQVMAATSQEAEKAIVFSAFVMISFCSFFEEAVLLPFLPPTGRRKNE